MVPFANQLRSLMNAATGKKYYLTAAPQCPYPDAADGPMLAGAVYFDAIFIQFYNNYCGSGAYVPGAASQNNFNFATWDNWAKTVSLNPNVKILLGIPGAPTAAGSGYVTGSQLASVIAYSKSFSSFGGVMIWDMSQIYANSGFLNQVAADLGLPAATTMVTSTRPTSTPKPTATSPGSTTPTGGAGTVNQWGQCGGQDWHGGTVCVAPYKCVYSTVWYSDCR
jgi:chitinase